MAEDGVYSNMQEDLDFENLSDPMAKDLLIPDSSYRDTFNPSKFDGL